MTEKVRARHIKLKRAYRPSAASDGKRILVDRLWPRGVCRSEARIDGWAKDIAPSAALRRWFGHDPARWRGFRARYAEELRANPERLRDLRRIGREGVVTLVYAARDEEHNDAVVLRDILLGRWPRPI